MQWYVKMVIRLHPLRKPSGGGRRTSECFVTRDHFSKLITFIIKKSQPFRNYISLMYSARPASVPKAWPTPWYIQHVQTLFHPPRPLFRRIRHNIPLPFRPLPPRTTILHCHTFFSATSAHHCLPEGKTLAPSTLPAFPTPSPSTPFSLSLHFCHVMASDASDASDRETEKV